MQATLTREFLAIDDRTGIALIGYTEDSFQRITIRRAEVVLALVRDRCREESGMDGDGDHIVLIQAEEVLQFFSTWWTKHTLGTSEFLHYDDAIIQSTGWSKREVRGDFLASSDQEQNGKQAIGYRSHHDLKVNGLEIGLHPHLESTEGRFIAADPPGTHDPIHLLDIGKGKAVRAGAVEHIKPGIMDGVLKVAGIRVDPLGVEIEHI